MPYVINPSDIPPPPEQVTGADGILTATLWPEGSGVLLHADFSGTLADLPLDQTWNMETDAAVAEWAPYGTGTTVARNTTEPISGNSDMKWTWTETGSHGAVVDLAEGMTGNGQDSLVVSWRCKAAAPGTSWRLAIHNQVTGAIATINSVTGASSYTKSYVIPDGVVADRVYLYLIGTTATGETQVDDIRINSSASHGAVAFVRFTRFDQIPVRSGSDARAIGNEAYAFDHEAPIGRPSTWFAAPVFADGTVGDPSAGVTLTLPRVAVNQLWVKSVTDATLSVLATVLGPLGDITYAARSEQQDVLGSAYPVSSWDVWQAAAVSLQFDVDDATERAALQAVLTSGVVLLQTNPEVDFSDLYAQPGDLVRSRYDTVHGVTDTAQELATTFTEVARPSPVGAAKSIPHYSWGDVDMNYANWTHVNAAVEDWRALATGITES